MDQAPRRTEQKDQKGASETPPKSSHKLIDVNSQPETATTSVSKAPMKDEEMKNPDDTPDKEGEAFAET